MMAEEIAGRSQVVFASDGSLQEKKARGRSNRRKGNEAQNEWAKRIEGKNVGRLGEFDVLGPDNTAWEVKSWDKVQEKKMIDALYQAEQNAWPSGRNHGVAIRLRNQPEDRRWLVVRVGLRVSMLA